MALKHPHTQYFLVCTQLCSRLQNPTDDPGSRTRVQLRSPILFLLQEMFHQSYQGHCGHILIPPQIFSSCLNRKMSVKKIMGNTETQEEFLGFFITHISPDKHLRER